ncbi:hypothetical protein PG993_010464 [Apiospora rasikravindrae]|uniref:SET domain-containing protein n=1 Tax=Apiospora rasikravindrae TaxID=990691 RepID=A0ABR1SMD1_9PEZI
MAELDDFVRLAQGQGVQLNGIEPARIPGRGIGVVATRTLKPGEAILEVPMQVVRSLHSISEAVSSQLPAGISFHGILAADLALDKNAYLASWRKLLPTEKDLTASMPLLWPAELQALLPKAASDMVLLAAGQHPDVLPRDPGAGGTSLGGPAGAAPRRRPVQSCGRPGCHVAYSATEYTITTRRQYEAGEEVFASYGNHSNDFLLAEYGFVMAENKWDSVCLDEVVMSRLTRAPKNELEANGHAGPYMLSAESGPSRQLVAVLQKLAPSDKSSSASHDGADTSLELGTAAKKLLKVLIGEALENAQGIRAKILGLQAGNPAQRNMLYHRWEQIATILLQAIGRLN